MSITAPAPVADLTALVRDTSRDEMAFKAVGAAADKVRRAGVALLVAFEEFDARKDELLEERIAEVKVFLDPAIESAYATYRTGLMSRERHETPVEVWPVRDLT